MLRQISQFSDKRHMMANNKKIKVRRYGVVHVVLIKAKYLARLNPDGKFSDPYCELSVGKEKVRSKMIPNSTNPEWKEAFNFDWYAGFDDELKITLWNKKYWDSIYVRDIGPVDDKMGNVNIDLKDFEVEKTHHIWKRLDNGLGRLSILLTISGTTSEDSVTNLKGVEDKIESVKNRWKETITSITLRPKTNGVGYLMVKVLEAKGLCDMDYIGKSDPFCVIQLNNYRFVTQTECDNLAPCWQKVFQFENVQDICDVLDITVYDEDNDHMYNFLGRVKIPLLNIKNNEKRWYLLKNKTLRSPAPGQQPQILLEMFFIYDKFWGCLKTLRSPRPIVHRHERLKKENTASYNINRIKAATSDIDLDHILSIIDKLRNCNATTTIGIHIAFIFLIYFFELWMLPLGLSIPFLMNLFLLPEKKAHRENIKSYVPELDDDEEDRNKEEEEEKINDAVKELSWLTIVTQKMRLMQDMHFTVQLGLELLANELESMQNLFIFIVPLMSWIALSLLLFSAILLKFASPRYLLMALVTKRMIQNMIGGSSLDMVNFFSFMSRVPDNEELEDYRELPLLNENSNAKKVTSARKEDRTNIDAKSREQMVCNESTRQEEQTSSEDKKDETKDNGRKTSVKNSVKGMADIFSVVSGALDNNK